MNELPHKVILIERINKDLTRNRGYAIVLAKHNRSAIQNLPIAWELFKTLPEMGFTIIEDGKGITNRT